MKKIFMAGMVASALSACAGTAIDWNKARQVKDGMSEAEVTVLIGRPYIVSSVAKGEQRWIWSYATAFGGTSSMTVTMEDCKAVKVPEIPSSF